MNKTRQVVSQAVKIASRDVRTPKVVRTGAVQKTNRGSRAVSNR